MLDRVISFLPLRWQQALGRPQMLRGILRRNRARLDEARLNDYYDCDDYLARAGISREMPDGTARALSSRINEVLEDRDALREFRAAWLANEEAGRAYRRARRNGTPEEWAPANTAAVAAADRFSDADDRCREVCS